MNEHYQMLGFWFYHEIDSLLGKPKINLELPNGNTIQVKGNSDRLKLLKNNPECVICNKVGTLWILQCQNSIKQPWANSMHLGLYWVGYDGLTQMTKDHVQPLSKNGRDHISNMQTLCEHCNKEKGNKLSYWPKNKGKFRDQHLSFYPNRIVC